ncbi:hypothetical protein EAG_02193 [Camponotus floridanus]|uniref:Uncharacterized protein n=1 Tax=Camponotus floridanus TaxID=104421 RepID=E2AH32_CAMFO|nr:hypothetical protein EAG_02193 [Camponotus floridanus]
MFQTTNLNADPMSRPICLAECKELSALPWITIGIPAADDTSSSLASSAQSSRRSSRITTRTLYVSAVSRSEGIRITRPLSEQGTFSLSDEESPRTRRRQLTTIDEDNDDDYRN